ncbi:hypothetical protein EDD15DRAFT_2284624 [Pisolithus albus]|nr:hypothetical protein EDD15DRAFT_2284624 [Pisolithus albus]
MSLSVEERLSYVTNIPLKAGDPLSPELLACLCSAQTAAIETPSQEKQDTLGVVDGHGMAFTRDLSADQKEAAEISSLWAQFAANAAFDRVTQPEKWFRKYIDFLHTAGWVGQGSRFDSLDRAGGIGSGDNVVMLLMEREGYNEKAIDTFRRMTKTLKGTAAGQRAYALWKKDTGKLNEASFQVGICELDCDDVVWKISSHSYNTKGFNGDILFFHFSNDEIHYRYSFESLKLSVTAWDDVKALIRDKVKDYRKEYIMDAPLKPS